MVTSILGSEASCRSACLLGSGVTEGGDRAPHHGAAWLREHQPSPEDARQGTWKRWRSHQLRCPASWRDAGARVPCVCARYGMAASGPSPPAQLVSTKALGEAHTRITRAIGAPQVGQRATRGHGGWRGDGWSVPERPARSAGGWWRARESSSRGASRRGGGAASHRASHVAGSGGAFLTSRWAVRRRAPHFPGGEGARTGRARQGGGWREPPCRQRAREVKAEEPG